MSQSVFQNVPSAKEIEDLLTMVVISQARIQLRTSASSTDFTAVIPYASKKNSIMARFISGPRLPDATNATITFELEGSKYFSTSRCLTLGGNEYLINFENLYKLQRRDFFRVVIPPEVMPAFVMSETLDAANVGTNFRILDLSTGGVAIEVFDSADSFKDGAILTGTLAIGQHTPLGFKAVQKYKRKSGSSYQVGLEFTDKTVAFTQKVSFIVNECHRQIFAKMPK